MLDRPPADRRRGRIVLRIEADEHGLVEALMRAGRLDEAGGLLRSRVEHEVARLVGDWVARWQTGDVTRGLSE